MRMFIVAMLAVLAFPMLMCDSTVDKGSLDDDKHKDCHNDNQRYYRWMYFIADVGFGENMHYGVTDHGPAAEGVEQVQEELEVMLRKAFLDNDH